MTAGTTPAVLGSARTVSDWFAELDPAPPAVLRAELKSLLAEGGNRPVSDVPEVCLAAGERLLNELIHSGSTNRPTALKLLAVDALVTYAFEAGADEPRRLEQRAAMAMQRISELAGQ